jgi:hypothetical protein
MSTIFDSGTDIAIDELLERYVSWLEECESVRLAYRQWDGGQRVGDRLAYASYVAALDREEHAARVYVDQIERVRQSATSRGASRIALDTAW